MLNENIPFMSWRFVGFILSTVLIGLSLFVWFTKGEAKYGLDFTGGSEVVAKISGDVDISQVRGALESKDVVVQAFGDGLGEFSIKVKASESKTEGAEIKDLLASSFGSDKVEIQKEDFVGPIVGEQIRKDGLTALAVAMLIILIYISVRFEFRFAVGAIVALLHDIVLTTGAYLISGREISAAVLAGLLTIIGYSLNDTIIVYDRIRENIEKDIKKFGMKKGAGTPLIQLINKSINQTLSRTLLTSLTTFFVVFILWVFGGGAVSDLAFTLVIGVVVGTYSSIFIASPVLLYLAAKAE